eukprot:TRINITY_DN2375_c0_g4_i1.p1 TRINITY_DN2375_c0_g4~~TRINITY_DN2375_c0_g4_i1.p1  ORF type:complete len:544 (+),score=52.57 TRINITY_DN2375_c0_g4_i1:219-1634(+)
MAISGGLMKPFLQKIFKAGQPGFMSSWEARKIFSPSNNGLVIDSDRLRLSEKYSMNHLLVLAPSGMGKTTCFNHPNIAALDNCSLIITDPKGSTLEQYAGILLAKDYEIITLNFINPKKTHHFNPLAACTSSEDIDQMVKGILSNLKEDYFTQNAASMLKLFSQALLHCPDKNIHTLKNLSYLIDSLNTAKAVESSSNPEAQKAYLNLTNFMAKHLPDEYDYNKFLAILNQSEKTLSSITSTATGALDSVISPDLDIISSANDIPIDHLRKKKIALFINIPPGRSARYHAFTSLFFNNLFTRLMEQVPGESELPIYMLLDEFGNMKIPAFDEIISQIREYKVSLSLIVQSLSQLKKRYGEHDTDTIVGNCSTKLICPGLDNKITEEISRTLGHVEVKDPQTGQSKKHAVADSSSIRTMADEAIIICSNLKPAQVDFKPAYANKRIQSLPKKGGRIEHPKSGKMRLVDLEHD